MCFFKNTDLDDNVFYYCEPKTLFNILRSGSCCHSAVTSYARRAFNIDALLQSFFNNPFAFRQVQQLTGTLISGSQALQFFTREHYSSSDMDLYVRVDFAEALCTWLIASEGYEHMRRQNDPIMETGPGMLNAFILPSAYYGKANPDGHGIAAVLDFRRVVLNKARVVQVIIVRGAPIGIILRFPTSKESTLLFLIST